MNEIGTTVSEFNISDYIWYIVGGIALFFIIVGFIADKSGLAKKTFSKDSGNDMKKDSKTGNVTPIVVPVENSDMISSVNDEILLVEDGEIQEPVMATDFVEEVSPSQIEEVVMENNDIVEEQPVIMEESVEETTEEAVDDFTSTEEPIYLNDAQEESTSPSQIEEETDSVWNIDSEEIIVEDDTLSVAADNAEEDWGMEPVSDSEDSSSLEDVELPALEDINTDTDEDVWKF